MEAWYELDFQEKLLEIHRAILFPENMDKKKQDFIIMVIQRLIDKTENMDNDQIEHLFTKN